jgi:hypothetical protein
VLRGLIHHGRVHLAVVLGAAVATAVLTGALLVGDSVRGSLRDLVLDRLGDIDHALLSERFFREDDLEAGAPEVGAAPAILLQGSATHADSGARASGIQVLGVDERFLGRFPPSGGDAAQDLPLERLPGQIFPSVILNVSLAEELGAGVGDAVLISFPRWSRIPSDTLLGSRETEDVVGTLRCSVTGVIPDRGVGRFGLSARQTFQKNAFVALDRLQQALDTEGTVNGLFLSGSRDAPKELDALLDRSLHMEDVGLTLSAAPDFLTVTSQEFVLRPGMVRAAQAAGEETGARLLPLQTYLANRIQAGDRVVPSVRNVAAQRRLPRPGAGRGRDPPEPMGRRRPGRAARRYRGGHVLHRGGPGGARHAQHVVPPAGNRRHAGPGGRPQHHAGLPRHPGRPGHQRLGSTVPGEPESDPRAGRGLLG